MKKKFYLLSILAVSLFIFTGNLYADAIEDHSRYLAYQNLPDEFKAPVKEDHLKKILSAEYKIKNLECRKWGTVGQYLDQKTSAPIVQDLGWKVEVLPEGAYDVERALTLNSRFSISYKWHIDKDGKVEAVNKEAVEITGKN